MIDENFEGIVDLMREADGDLAQGGQFVPAAEFGASIKRDVEAGRKLPFTDDLYFQVVPKASTK